MTARRDGLARLESVHRGLLARIPLLLIGIAGLVAAGVFLQRHARVEQDISMMLPGGPGSPREAARLLEEFGVLNTLLLELELPGASQDSLAEAGRALADSLRASGDFTEVYTGPSLEGMLQLGELLLPRRLYLLPNPLRELRARLEPARLTESLKAVKTRLASPQGFAQKRELLGDPLGLNDAFLKSLSSLQGDVQLYRGQLLDRAGTHLLLVTTPKRPALDSRASTELVARLERRRGALPAGAVLRIVGGPRFAAESIAAVERDIRLTLGTSVVWLMALFYARFRSLRLLLLVQLPLLLGMAGGLAAVQLTQGHVNAITFAFGAVMIGMGIDYSLYVLNTASVAPGEGLERLTWGIRKAWPALWPSFLTTFSGFMVMLLAQFPGIRELALFGGAGIAVALAVSLLFLPPLVTRFGPKSWPGVPRWLAQLRSHTLPAWLGWTLTLALLVFAALRLPQLTFDGELRHLDAQRPEVLAEYEAVMSRFGQKGTGSLVVARGDDAQRVLETNDAVTQLLGGLPHLGLGAFLPSLRAQRERARSLDALDLDGVRRQLDDVSGPLGFAPGAFAPFVEEIAAIREGRVAPLRPDDLLPTSLGPLVQRLLRCAGPSCLAVTVLPSPAPGAALSMPDLSRLPPGALRIDGDELALRTLSQLPRQLTLLTGLGLAVVIALLVWAYRSLRRAVLACVPCLLGLLGTLATLSALGIPLNLVSTSALVLVLGCGVDYGIFVLQETTRGKEHPAEAAVESSGVLLASLSTLGGFGVLVIARHPALHSLGFAVGLGVALSAASALVLLPSLEASFRREARR